VAPTSTGSDRDSCPAEFSRQGPLVHSELARRGRERRALLVAFGGEGDRGVGHLADDAPSRDAGLVEVVDDGRPVDVVPTGERVDR